MKHAIFSPSSLPSLAKCCGFRPWRDSDNPDAEEGRILHAVMERGDEEHGLTGEKARLIEFCQHVIRDHVNPGATVMRELYVSILHGATGGTIDLLAVEGTLATVIDYKFGRNYVPPPSENLQIKAYVLGAFQRLPAVDTVEAVIIAPRRDEVCSHVFRRDDIPELIAEVASVLDRAHADAPDDYVPGSHCHRCCRFAGCEAARSVIEDALKEELESADLGSLLPLADQAKAWAEAVRKAATSAAQQGRDIDGYRLIETTRLECPDATALVREGVADPIRLLAACSVSAATLRKIGLDGLALDALLDRGLLREEKFFQLRKAGKQQNQTKERENK